MSINTVEPYWVLELQIDTKRAISCSHIERSTKQCIYNKQWILKRLHKTTWKNGNNEEKNNPASHFVSFSENTYHVQLFSSAPMASLISALDSNWLSQQDAMVRILKMPFFPFLLFFFFLLVFGTPNWHLIQCVKINTPIFKSLNSKTILIYKSFI